MAFESGVRAVEGTPLAKCSGVDPNPTNIRVATLVVNFSGNYDQRTLPMGLGANQLECTRVGSAVPEFVEQPMKYRIKGRGVSEQRGARAQFKVVG